MMMRSALILLFLTSTQAYDNYGQRSAPGASCPTLRCANPCWDECDQETCETSVSTRRYHDLECETCPKFVKCHPFHRSGNGQQQQPQPQQPSQEAIKQQQSGNNFGSSGRQQDPDQLNFFDPLPNFPDMNSVPLPQGQNAPPPCSFITCPSNPCANVQCKQGEVCNDVIERFFPNNGNPCSDCSVAICEVLDDRIFGGGGVRPPISPPACPIPSCADPCTECRDNGGVCRLGPVSTFISGGRECPGCAVGECDKPCPRQACSDPCELCPGNQCIRGPIDTFVTDEGKTCPGCPTLEKCLPIDRPCPRPACSDPCELCPGNQCLRGPIDTFVTDEGKTCPGCPTLEKCLAPPRPQCPPPPTQCRDPCRDCFGQCETEPSFTFMDGLKCEECPILKNCYPQPPPPPPPAQCCAGREPRFCGRHGCTCCSDGRFYRDEKECQYQGLQVSEPCYEPQERCGTTMCARGLVCCNDSCGICTRPGEQCNQKQCNYNNYGYSNYKYGSYRGGDFNNNFQRRGKGGKGMRNRRT